MVQEGEIDTDSRTPHELLQEVINTCVALQGSLITRDVSFDDLLSIESMLKESLATSTSHRRRTSGYPVKLSTEMSTKTFEKPISRKRPAKKPARERVSAKEKKTTVAVTTDVNEDDGNPVYQLINFRTGVQDDQDVPFVLTLHEPQNFLTFHKFISKKDTGRSIYVC